jgi:hypothetical protein
MLDAIRGLLTYGLAGSLALAVLTIDIAIPPVVLGLAMGRWSAGRGAGAIQWIDGSHKGDWLNPRPSFGASPQPDLPSKMPTGCEPAFSPLSAGHAKTNDAFRCIAASDDAHALT